MATEAHQRHSLTLEGSLSSADKGSEWARALAQRSGLSEKHTAALDLCINELVVNIVTHSYRGEPGEIRLDLDLAPDAAILTVTDTGPAFDPLSVPSPAKPTSIEEAKIGGYGIHLVRCSADACVYRRRDGRNVFMTYFGRTA
jgi:anti-sigma regulatory factor (Ser/Thr protein kinase)